MFRVNKWRSACASLQRLPMRYLNLQEYQSKELMQKFGLNIQRFRVASNLTDAEDISRNFKVREYVIKAQVLAGGRGKGVFTNGFKGGVHLTKDPAKVPEIVGKMLQQRLITKQTSEEGVLVNKVMVAEALDIARETYLAMLTDRTAGGIVIVCSPDGGMEIEEVAHKNPSSIMKEPIDIEKGITDEQGERIARHLRFTDAKHIDVVKKQLHGLYKMFVHYDCTQIEVNPFGETPDGQIVNFDAKFNFDDNAAFRQKDVFSLHDPVAEELDPKEVDATKNGLNYVGLTGNIGCMVNGAGLAMATMDIVQLHGGRPANFLDLGGGVTVPQVEQAVRILSSDKNVRAILINIFGGIVNCATVAQGLTTACKSAGLSIPLVVRLEGTNVEEARRILTQSGLPMKTSDNLDEAAKMAVASIR